MKSYIKAISYYTPSKCVSNADIVKEFPEWSEKKISCKIGINQRFVASEMTAGDMALKCAEKLFSEHNIDRSEIDIILLCTQSPDYKLPTTACILQDKLGLRTDTGAFDYNLGCSGFVYGLAIAKGFIESRIAKNILLITSETYQKYIHPKDRGNRTLFSDAAAATLISVEGWAEIGCPILGTDGSGYRNLIVEAGGAKMEKQNREPSGEDNRSPDYLYMDGPAIFNFTLDAVPKLVDKLLNINKLSLSDIDLFVFHQANKHMLKFIREVIGIPEEKFYMCLESFGNTVSSTLPIALYHAYKEECFSIGDKVMITGFGVGYSWGGEVLTIK